MCFWNTLYLVANSMCSSLQCTLYWNKDVYEHKPRNAVGEMFPFLMDTMIVIPVSRKGIEKSTASLLFGVIFNDVSTISAILSWICLINPFHSPVF